MVNIKVFFKLILNYYIEIWLFFLVIKVFIVILVYVLIDGIELGI